MAIWIYMILMTLHSCVTQHTRKEIGTQQPVTLISHPENVTAVEEEKVTLKCVFSKVNVNCQWQQNGNVISGDDHYKVHTNNTTGDCSLTVAFFRPKDTGRWRCYQPANSFSEGVFSKEAHLTMTITVTGPGELKDTSTQDVTYKSDSSVYMNCKFTNPVICLWKRRGQRVVVEKSRYKFSNARTSFDSDCTLWIVSFRPAVDEGRWTCLQIANSSSGQVQSKIFFLRSHSQDGFPNSSHIILFVIGFAIFILDAIAIKCIYNKIQKPLR